MKRISVYDGGPPCYSVAAGVAINCTANSTYHILAGGYDGQSGNLNIIADVVPRLTITRQTTTNVLLSWSAAAYGFHIESATNLTHPLWTNALWPSLNSSNYQATDDITAPAKLYRLNK